MDLYRKKELVNDEKRAEMDNRQTRELDIISYGRKNTTTKKKGTGQKSVRTKENDRERQSRLREERKRKRRRKVFIARFLCAFFICLVMGIASLCIYHVVAERTGEEESFSFSNIGNIFHKGNDWTIEDMFGMLEEEGITCTQDFLSVNEYSRPAEELKKVKNIFIHYTANPGTDAAQNRSYFENLGQTHETSASAHFIIGYEGEIVQCIPLDEIAYAVAGRNQDSISIECCYLDESGQFTEETYRTLVHFSAILLEKYGLEADDLRRHYDEGGKNCPKYYVENEEAWRQFVEDVKEYKESLN